MSGGAAAESAPAEPATGALGVLATWRQTSSQVRALLAGVFVSRLAGFLQIFLVLFLTHRGFSPSQAGFALGTYGAGAVAGSVTGGWLSDRLAARTATLISMLGSAALIVSIIYLRFYPIVLAAVLLAGVIGQFYRPAAQTLVTELTPPGQLVMVTAMYRLCQNLGTTATPLIGVALVSVSYNLLFWGEALAAVSYALIALRFLPSQLRKPAEPTADTGGAAGAAGAERRPRSGYLAVLTDVRYMFFLTAVLLVIVVYVQYTATLPLAIVHAGLSLWWYGAVVTLNAAIVVICEVPATRFVQNWPLRVTAIGGFGLIVIGYGMYAIAMVPVILIIGTLIWTANEIIGAPTTFAYPGMIAPSQLRGRYIGAMQSVFGLATAIGPIVGVALWYHVGQRVWLWAAGVAIVSTLCALVGMRRPSVQPSPEPATEPVG